LRKYLIAALAALLSIAVAAVAVGQGPATATVKLSPSKAGTKKKPKSVKLTLSVTNQTPGTTASRIDILLPRFVRASGKGLPVCKAATLEAGRTCSTRAKAGGGIANALINPAGANPAPLRFKVTAYNSGRNLLLFHLQQVNRDTGQVISGGVSRVLVGKVSRASGANFYQKIRIDIPEDLQQPSANVYSALEDLTTSISLKKGKKSLLTTVGCPKSKEHVLGVVITYAPNPGPPPRPSSSAEGTAKCSK
jgi:hypothetical protein